MHFGRFRFAAGAALLTAAVISLELAPPVASAHLIDTQALVSNAVPSGLGHADLASAYKAYQHNQTDLEFLVGPASRVVSA